MSPRVFLIGETSDPADLPARPTYMFMDASSIERYFEKWYVNENYTCVSDDGRIWRLSESEGGLSLKECSRSNRETDLFRAWFRHWVDKHKQWFVENGYATTLDEQQLESILNEVHVLRALSV